MFCKDTIFISYAQPLSSICFSQAFLLFWYQCFSFSCKKKLIFFNYFHNTRNNNELRELLFSTTKDTKMHKEVTEDIKHYISREIIPIYDGFDAAHDRAHAEAVITESLALAKYYNINIDMVYVVAAYHDIGLKYGRENHHIESGRLLREDATLRKWFKNG